MGCVSLVYSKFDSAARLDSIDHFIQLMSDVNSSIISQNIY
jgi:hypothetical protein